jgi:hypothetical protein
MPIFRERLTGFPGSILPKASNGRWHDRGNVEYKSRVANDRTGCQTRKKQMPVNERLTSEKKTANQQHGPAGFLVFYILHSFDI